MSTTSKFALDADAPISAFDFVNTIPDVRQRADCNALMCLMQDITGVEPVMWGPSIVGFGRKSRREAARCLCDGLEIGFSPRRGRTVLYLRRFSERYDSLIAGLGDNIRRGHVSLSFADLAAVNHSALVKLLDHVWRDVDSESESTLEGDVDR